jgi:transketolase N-terminal domain/subunit
MTALESEDRRDPNRARVVLSKGHEVVGPGYLRVTGVAGKVTDKRENLGYHDRVNRVSQNSNTDQQADRVGRVSRVGQVTRFSPNSSTD